MAAFTRKETDHLQKWLEVPENTAGLSNLAAAKNASEHFRVEGCYRSIEGLRKGRKRGRIENRALHRRIQRRNAGSLQNLQIADTAVAHQLESRDHRRRGLQAPGKG